MKRKPLVSVLLPAYNHEKYVAAAIESIIEQSYPNLELLICDDHSPDGTADVVRSLADRYSSRIKLHLGRKNRGVASRFNLLCGMASGDYIAPFASDDRLPGDAIEKRIDFLEANPDVDVLATDMSVIDSNERILNKARQRKLVSQFNRLYEVDFNKLYESLLYGNFIPAGTLCFRMHRIGKQELMHDDLCPDLHDYDVWLQLSRKYRWAFLNRSTYFYRWHGDNLSSPQNRSIESLAAIVSQTTYILTKQLLNRQTREQRKATLGHISRNCRALFDVLPQETGSIHRGDCAAPSHDVGRSTPVPAAPGARTIETGSGPKAIHPFADGKGPAIDASVDALLQQGKQLYAAGQLKQACDTFIQVLDIEPAHLEAVINLGKIALQAGNSDQAGFFFSKAIEIDPSCETRLKRITDQIGKVCTASNDFQQYQADVGLPPS